MGMSLFSLLPSSVRAHVQNEDGLNRIAGNIAWLALDYALRLGVSFFVLVWLARHLGPSHFGIYSYALALVTLLSAIATLGLNNIVIRDIVKTPEHKEKILGSACILKLAAGILTILLALGIVHIAKHGENNTVLRGVVAIISVGFIFRSLDVIDFWFQSQVLSKCTVIARTSAGLILNTARVVFILRGAPLICFAWLALMEIAAEATALAVAYTATGGRITRWRVGRGTARQLFADSWPLALSGLAVAVYMRIDQIMIGQFLGDAHVGVYSASIRLAALWYFIPNAIVPSVFPAIVRARQMSERVYFARLQVLYDLLCLTSITVAIVVTLARRPVVMLLYGSEYIEAAGVLPIHMWAGVFVGLGVASQRFLLTENLAKVASARTSIGCLTNVVLNLLLIPRMGIRGAAIATVASQSVAAFSIVVHRAGRTQALVMLKSLCLIGIFSYVKERIAASRT